MRRRVDRPLFILAIILTVAGLLVISSASVVVSQKNFGTPYYYFLHQLAAAGVGFAFLLIFQAIPYRVWKRFGLPLLILSLLLGALVFAPNLGLEFGGATRWLKAGPISLQPSEIIKLSLILYLAGWLDKRKSQAKGFVSTFLPFVMVVGAVASLLVLQKDIGTLIVVGGGAAALYTLGGGRISQLLALAALGVGGVFVLALIEPYRWQRIQAFLNADADPLGVGYHIKQALIAIGSGGFWGRGFGQSIQKYNYLPEPIGDSVFAVVVEEFGFFGGFILALLLFAFFIRCIQITRRAPDFFGKLLVSGIASLVAFQAFINMAAISGLLPLTGIPLPFVSYGGTSLVVTLAMVGIALNVSKSAQAS